VTERQLRDDLQLLFVCGLPGYGPGDLIDMVLDEDTVSITFDAGMDRPLRLTADEALALVVALRALAELPGLSSSEAIESALAKLESAAGDAGVGTDQIAVRMHADPDRLAAVQGALDRGRALRITYYTAARDATTERVVDPIRVLLVEGRSYLEAWCRHAEGLRRFRLDRIDALTELDEPSRPNSVAGEVGEAAFQPSPADPLVRLRLGRQARWVSEYYPCETVQDEPGGTTVVTLRTGDLGWARRLVLGLGTEAEVLSPAELAEDVRSTAAVALKYYEGQTV
jgi:proteasome accessory factor C